MTPNEAIDALDRQIAAHGQSVSFKRSTSRLDARGFVREFKPEQLVGLITQQDRKVILSPSVLGTYGVPKAQDDVNIAGQIGKVQSVGMTHLNDVLVRLEIRVRLNA